MPHCLKFWYRFYGNDLVFLHVLQHGEWGEMDVWRVEGEPHGKWKEAEVDLQPRRFTQVVKKAF